MAKQGYCFRILEFLFHYIFGPLGTPIVCIFAPFYRAHFSWTFEWFQQRYVSNWSEHKRKVAAVQQQVRRWHAGGRKTRMCTAKPSWNSWTLHGVNKRGLEQINVDQLNCVVEVDELNRILTVEPGIMMGQLTSILIPRGWTIPVVPEFENLSFGK
jgi:delta24-sterol reductase